MEETKACKVCSAEQPITEFARIWSNKGQKYYRRHQCKSCERKRTLQYHHENRESVIRRHSSQQILAKYGLSNEQYEMMLTAQGGVCAICKSKCATGRKLSVDHDHTCCPGKNSCGKCVRALLCTRCNMGLGLFKDALELLSRATNYLRTHNGNR